MSAVKLCDYINQAILFIALRGRPQPTYGQSLSILVEGNAQLALAS